MSEKIKEVTTKELAGLIQNPGETKLVDIRPMAAYNGWRLERETRGGHLSGAKNIPLQWTRFMDWVEVLEEKNIAKNKPVVIYGYDRASLENMAEKLHKLGYNQLRFYPYFLTEWIADPGLPLEKLEKYQQLVHPKWVHQLINGENPQNFKGNNYVVCHSHYGYPEDYEKGHIPGAISLNTNWLESTETWNHHAPIVLKKRLEGLGIGHDTTVILYGRYSAPTFDKEEFPGRSAGHLGAIRCAAIMLYAGVKDVRILNGGLTTWELEGYKLSKKEVPPKPIKDFGTKIPAHPEFMIDTPKAKEYLAGDDSELVSIRSWEEYIGERSGYHYIEKKGRIPGAVFGNCGSDAYHMENYRNFDHTIRQADEVAEKWEQEGLTPDKKLAFYCGTGWRGSEAFFNAYLMGWPKVAVYDGGWFEWSNDPENEIATGVPKS